MNKKLKKFCTTLNYIGHLLDLPSVVIGCVSTFHLASLVVLL